MKEKNRDLLPYCDKNRYLHLKAAANKLLEALVFASNGFSHGALITRTKYQLAFLDLVEHLEKIPTTTAGGAFMLVADAKEFISGHPLLSDHKFSESRFKNMLANMGFRIICHQGGPSIHYYYLNSQHNSEYLKRSELSYPCRKRLDNQPDMIKDTTGLASTPKDTT